MRHRNVRIVVFVGNFITRIQISVAGYVYAGLGVLPDGRLVSKLSHGHVFRPPALLYERCHSFAAPIRGEAQALELAHLTR